VLSALFAADAPTTAEQIANGLGGRLPTLDLSSVARDLERVEQLGFVGHVHLDRGPGRYALARDGDSEYLGCEQCGRVTAVDTADLDPVRETVRRTLDTTSASATSPSTATARPARATARRGT
jgi:Fur family ferric uptake transcriptional regulator